MGQISHEPNQLDWISKIIAKIGPHDKLATRGICWTQIIFIFCIIEAQ